MNAVMLKRDIDAIANSEAWDGVDWSRGACRGVTGVSFFPERGHPSQPAVCVCAGCPIRVACAEYAIEAKERFGVWGGLSERQRRRISVARAKAAA